MNLTTEIYREACTMMTLIVVTLFAYPVHITVFVNFFMTGITYNCLIDKINTCAPRDLLKLENVLVGTRFWFKFSLCQIFLQLIVLLLQSLEFLLQNYNDIVSHIHRHFSLYQLQIYTKTTNKLFKSFLIQSNNYNFYDRVSTFLHYYFFSLLVSLYYYGQLLIYSQQFLKPKTHYILSNQTQKKIISQMSQSKLATPCFIEKMQMQINSYRIDNIKRFQEEQNNQQIFIKQKNAKLALIQLDQNQRNKSINDFSQIQGWNVQNQKQTRIIKETDKQRYQVKENDKQRVTIVSLAYPEKRCPFKSLNRNTGMDVINQESSIIPHLKTLLERLSSPVKKRKQNGNFLSQRAASSAINYSKSGLKIHFQNQKDVDLIMMKQTKQNIKRSYQKKQEQKQFSTPQTKKDDPNDDFACFSQGGNTYRQKNYKGEARAATSNANRLCFNPGASQKPGALTLKIVQVETEFPPKQKFKQNSVARTISETQPLKSISGTKYPTNFENFEYSKIKRKHPSAYQIDVAYEKELLHQLIKGSQKPNYKSSSHNVKPDSSSNKRNAQEKFTLKYLLQ